MYAVDGYERMTSPAGGQKGGRPGRRTGSGLPVWLAVATALILLVACGGGGASQTPTAAVEAAATEGEHEAAAPAATSRGQSQTTTSSAVAPTVPPASGPGATLIGPATAASLNCPISGPSVGFGNVVSVDFDGNGNAEIFRAYLNGSVWHVALEDGSGNVFDDEVPTLVNSAVFPQGPADVNGDGTEEAWIVIGADPATAYLGIYALVGCDLTRVFDGGQPALFRVGVTVTYLYGVVCADQNGDGVTDVIQYYGTSIDGLTYTVNTSVVTVTPQGTVVPLLSPPSFTTTNPGLYSKFECGGLQGVQLTG